MASEIKIIRELKHGLGSTKIELVEYDNELVVIKYFKTINKLNKEIELYQKIESETFVPKIKFINRENKKLALQYCGESLNNKYIPKERYLFKEGIRKIVDELQRKYSIYHNDIRWKNICINETGELKIIDWERWDYVNKERDPEYILTDKNKEQTLFS